MRLIDADKLRYKHSLNMVNTTIPQSFPCITKEEINKVPTVEAIPKAEVKKFLEEGIKDVSNNVLAIVREDYIHKADYEARLKADLEAILVELQLEIEEKVHSYHSRYCSACEAIDRKSVSNLIEQKINALKADQEGGGMKREPFLAHSELTNEIYIVAGNEKYRVTEQAIKAVKAIKTLEQEPTTKNNLGVDCISREQALVAIRNLYPGMPRVDFNGSLRKWVDKYKPYIECDDAIEQLPSVTPQEPRWIPVSERLPEENKTVIASTEYEVCPETRYTEEDGWEWAYEAGAGYWEKLAGVKAWMPLPEQYKAESENT